jgi:hypothetical protein
MGAEMFGVGDFWLEIKVIIKSLSHPLTDFHGDEAKNFQFSIKFSNFKT